MLTTKDIKTKYGDNITFLFKGQEPFTGVENPKGEEKPAGVLIEREGKVQCYECGGWFKDLGHHVKIHKISPQEYKEKYGFNKTAGICCKELSKTRSDISIDTQMNLGKKYHKNLEFGRKFHSKNETMQMKNGKNTCPEQMKNRLKLLMIKHGEKLSAKEAKKYDYGVVNWAFKNGGWNKAKEENGFVYNKWTGKEKNEADLIYDLREYVKENHYLPFYTYKYDGHTSGDKRDSFSHSITSYKAHFGSRIKAWLHCGIVKTDKWLELDGKRLKYLDVLD